MVGMGVGGNEKIDLVYTEFPEIAYNPVALVDFPGIDQDDLVPKEDDRRVPLADIKEIYPEVTRCSLARCDGLVRYDRGDRYIRQRRCR